VPDFKDISHIGDMWSYVSELPNSDAIKQGSQRGHPVSRAITNAAEEDEELLNIFQHVQIAKKPALITDNDPPSKPQIKSILRKPTEKFPEYPEDEERVIARLEDSSRKLASEKGKQVPSGAKWTKIDRRLVNPSALEEAGERFEERKDCVIVLRILTKEEIQRLADRTREIRVRRDERVVDMPYGSDYDDVGHTEQGYGRHYVDGSVIDIDSDDDGRWEPRRSHRHVVESDGDEEHDDNDTWKPRRGRRRVNERDADDELDDDSP
jgi:hypothetical protein